jgi:hypothetical protein
LDDEDDFGEEDGEMVNDHLEGLQDLINSLGGPENFQQRVTNNPDLQELLT